MTRWVDFFEVISSFAIGWQLECVMVFQACCQRIFAPKNFTQVSHDARHVLLSRNEIGRHQADFPHSVGVGAFALSRRRYAVRGGDDGIGDRVEGTWPFEY